MDHLKNEGMHGEAKSDKFAFAQHLRKNPTPEEAKLWDYLKQRPLGYKFRRQHPFNDYVLDFYCHRAKLSIEIDGGIHIMQEQYDKDRTAIISEYGISEIRFTNIEIHKNFKKVEESITSILKAITKNHSL
jgi:very-short-patch-repair endonuclease